MFLYLKNHHHIVIDSAIAAENFPVVNAGKIV